GALRDPARDVRATATQLLATLGAECRPVVKELVAVLRDDACRDAAMNALVAVGAEAADPVSKLLGDPDSRRRAEALTVLGRLGGNAREAVPAMARVLSDRRHSLRLQAIGALQPLGPAARAALPELLEALDDDDDVRQGAINLLTALGEEAAGPLSKTLR